MRREVPEGGGSTRGARVPTLKRLDDRRSLNVYEMHKRETGEMSGNAPRAVKQAVQKEGQEWRPTGDATDEPAPQGAPGRGRRLGGSGRAEPPKNRRKRSGKNRGEPRSGKNRRRTARRHKERAARKWVKTGGQQA